MRFAERAGTIFGQCAVVLGWRPDEFWAATPAELGCVLLAMTPETGEPPNAADMQKLMEQFPDG